MRRSTVFGGVAALALASALGAGCQPDTYVDKNFGTNLGADFVAPPKDAAAHGTDAGTNDNELSAAE